LAQSGLELSLEASGPHRMTATAQVYTRPTVYEAPIDAAPPADRAPHVYAAAPLITGYYDSHPVPPEPISGPIYDYAPGYGYDYTAPKYWNRGYWGAGYGFEWR
jgi:hypothetical protein